MDAFSYLSVLLSIILGLAITQVLQGARGLLLARRDIRHYWPSLVWAAMILVIATQFWWASFGLKGEQTWTFDAFAVVLLQTVMLYMLAALVLPDFAPGAPIDLEAHYFREARPFFGIALAMIATSFVKQVLLEGHTPIGVSLVVHALFAGLATLLMIVHRPRLHQAMALLTAAATTIYVVLRISQRG